MIEGAFVGEPNLEFAKAYPKGHGPRPRLSNHPVSTALDSQRLPCQECERMRSNLRIAIACILASGFIAASHDAFSRAVPVYEAPAQGEPHQTKADRLAVKHNTSQPG